MAASLLAGMTILMIGDSHLATPGYLITSLHEDLVAQGAKVHTLGICGSNAGDWLKASPAGQCGAAERKDGGKVVVLSDKTATTPISELIAADKPDLVLVVLGDTMAGYDKPQFPKTWAWQQTTDLAKAIAATGKRCVWVGPNWGSVGAQYKKTPERVKQVSGFLAANVAPCDYIDSLKFSVPGQKEWATVDGQHMTAPGYKLWGDAIDKALLDTPAVKGLKK
ncbi:SGNH/GDSL hydrolase family protein [Pseudomonas sp. FSL R10-1350]|uniref:SGNH/GDSL hydrolase family protein n=2 Tax=Pseudomonas TaxID=286 RepID=A0A6L5I1C7_9PSED|nr:SGNH/GDSL hydrolase family protein [Pseudomonas helleri]MQU64869.1 SGNH/GDSL hydrolase family protein [Pseudomonas sp. FSL R10-1350]